MPVIEPEDRPRKKALFTARIYPSVVDTLARLLRVPQQLQPTLSRRAAPARYAFSRYKKFQNSNPLDKQEERS